MKQKELYSSIYKVTRPSPTVLHYKGKHQKNERSVSPMVYHFEGKNEIMNSIPSYLREHYSKNSFLSCIFLFIK